MHIRDDNENTNEQHDEPTTDTSAPAVQDGGDNGAPQETERGAFRRGVEEARAAEGVTSEGPTGAEPPAEGKGANGATAGATGAAPPAKKEPTEEERHKAEVDKEIKELGLKDKKAERFRTLEAGAAEAKKLRTEIEPLREKAQRLDQMNAVIQDTRATPDQIGTMFAIVKGLNSESPEEQNKAADRMYSECQAAFKELGRPMPGYSPISEDAELLEALTKEEITEERALQLIRARAVERRATQATETRRQREQEARDETTTVETAIAELTEMTQELRAADEHFDYKYKQFAESGVADTIKQLHPSKWAEETRKAFARVKGPPPKPRPAHMPMRPTGVSAAGGGGNGTIAKEPPKDERAAFRFGVDQAKANGL